MNPREWIYCYHNPRPGNKKFPERCFARDKKWKLYRSGALFDLSDDVNEKNPLAMGLGMPGAAAARRKLRAALDSMPQVPANTRLVKKEARGLSPRNRNEAERSGTFWRAGEEAESARNWVRFAA